ncbi:MAG: Fis family transcriptional regulator [Chloroflexi bacterium]|nr:Fis family transcriptional regulator [Chloroflexota bacterium]
MGNKLMYTTDEISRALEEANGLISVAARRLGCSVQTIYNRAKEVGELRDIIQLARREMVDLAESSLRIAVEKGEPWAVSLVLRTLGKDLGYTERVETAGVVDRPVEVWVRWGEDDNSNLTE